jgi:hypothetical protein
MSSLLHKRAQGTPLGGDLHSQMALVQRLDANGVDGIDEDEYVDMVNLFFGTLTCK